MKNFLRISLFLILLFPTHVQTMSRLREWFSGAKPAEQVAAPAAEELLSPAEQEAKRKALEAEQESKRKMLEEEWVLAAEPKKKEVSVSKESEKAEQDAKKIIIPDINTLLLKVRTVAGDEVAAEAYPFLNQINVNITRYREIQNLPEFKTLLQDNERVSLMLSRWIQREATTRILYVYPDIIKELRAKNIPSTLIAADLLEKQWLDAELAALQSGTRQNFANDVLSAVNIVKVTESTPTPLTKPDNIEKLKGLMSITKPQTRSPALQREVDKITRYIQTIY